MPPPAQTVCWLLPVCKTNAQRSHFPQSDRVGKWRSLERRQGLWLLCLVTVLLLENTRSRGGKWQGQRKVTSASKGFLFWVCIFMGKLTHWVWTNITVRVDGDSEGTSPVGPVVRNSAACRGSGSILVWETKIPAAQCGQIRDQNFQKKKRVKEMGRHHVQPEIFKLSPGCC